MQGPTPALPAPTLGVHRSQGHQLGLPTGTQDMWGHTETQLGQGHNELQLCPAWERWSSGGQGHNEQVLGQGGCTRANGAQPICTRGQQLFPLWEGLWEPCVGLPTFQWGSGCSGCGSSPQGSDGKVGDSQSESRTVQSPPKTSAMGKEPPAVPNPPSEGPSPSQGEPLQCPGLWMTGLQLPSWI